MSTYNDDHGLDIAGVFIWFGMDRYGRIAIMLNNGIGGIPEALLNPNKLDYKAPKNDDYGYVADPLISHKEDSDQDTNTEEFPAIALFEDDEEAAFEFIFEEDQNNPLAFTPVLEKNISLAELIEEERSFLLSLLLPKEVEQNVDEDIADDVEDSQQKSPAMTALDAILARYQSRFSLPRLSYNSEKYTLLRLEYRKDPRKDQEKLLGSLLEEYGKYFSAQFSEDEASDTKNTNDLAKARGVESVLDALMHEYEERFDKNIEAENEEVTKTTKVEATETEENSNEVISDETVDEKEQHESQDVTCDKQSLTSDGDDSTQSSTKEDIDEDSIIDEHEELFKADEIEQLESYKSDSKEKEGFLLAHDNDYEGEVTDHYSVGHIQEGEESTSNKSDKYEELTSTENFDLSKIQSIIRRKKESETLAEGFANLALQRGFYIYQAVYGGHDSVDFHNPVEYIDIVVEDKTIMGDYYRYLTPDSNCTIDAIPPELQHLVVVSDILDFTKDRLLRESKIDEFFTRLYQG